MDQITLGFDDEPTEVKDGKKCSKCKKVLPRSFFSIVNGGSYVRSECRKCTNELKAVRNELRQKYGMPSENYVCPVCFATEEEAMNLGSTNQGAWVVDHCHQTNTFRGWLCHKCNRGLGNFNDNSEILKRAIEYLGKHNE
jgi:hypothetical protein